MHVGGRESGVNARGRESGVNARGREREWCECMWERERVV
jgi:hypothetical protein